MVVMRRAAVLVSQGLTAEKIALSIAAGLGLGLFPVVGSTSLLCLIAAIAFKLNLPAIQVVSHLVIPAQLALAVPFMHLGARIVGEPPVALSMPQMLDLLARDPAYGMMRLGVGMLYAILGWTAVSPVLTIPVYSVLLPVLRLVRFDAPGRLFAVQASASDDGRRNSAHSV
jgi:hypothetical protein